MLTSFGQRCVCCGLFVTVAASGLLFQHPHTETQSPEQPIASAAAPASSSSSSGSVTVTPGVGQLRFTGFAPTVLIRPA